MDHHGSLEVMMLVVLNSIQNSHGLAHDYSCHECIVGEFDKWDGLEEEE